MAPGAALAPNGATLQGDLAMREANTRLAEAGALEFPAAELQTLESTIHLACLAL